MSFIQQQLPNGCSKDLVSASMEKLEYFPKSKPSGAVNAKDEGEWLEEMTEKAERGCSDPEIQFTVGQHHFLHEDYHLAIKYFEKAAGLVLGSSGGYRVLSGGYDMQAKYQLGVMYYDGLGVMPDSVKGSRFMLEVAQSKNNKKDFNIIPSALYNLGRAYFMGFGVQQSDSEAEKWWCEAAQAGKDSSSVRAKHTLGLFYSRKDSINLQKSFKWHKEAADEGHLESMAAVGLMYDMGQGCSQDTNAGLHYLRLSSKGGSIYGTGLLSRHYLDAKMFLRATETAYRVSEVDQSCPPGEENTMPLTQLDRIGVAVSCFVLARCLELGNGIMKNPVKAKHYFDKAIYFDQDVVSEMHTQRIHGSL